LRNRATALHMRERFVPFLLSWNEGIEEGLLPVEFAPSHFAPNSSKLDQPVKKSVLLTATGQT